MNMNRFITTAMIIAAYCAGTLSAQERTNNGGLPRFAVISDIHFENNRGEGAKVKVPRALKNLLGKTPRVDAVFVVGDLTERGKAEEYEQLVAAFGDRSNVPEGVDVYFMLGYNHDVHAGENCLENYLTIVGQPLYHYVEIKGYPFIAISEWGADAVRSDEARQFLSDRLEDAVRKYPGKPVFVFTHLPPRNTCYGSSENDGDFGSNALLPVLNQYPQAIVFTGHTHFPLGDPRSIHQDKFTTVNDGGTAYSEVEPGVVDIGIHPENYEYVTEGVIVNVTADNDVEIERWDTYRNEEILPRWLVEAPHDGSRFTYKNRDGFPAPVFPRGTRPTVKNTGGSAVAVTFPQAADNDVVHHYIVEIKDDRQTVGSFRIFSQYYLSSHMPKQLTVNFSDLPAGKKLTAQVKAVDSYNNQSAPVVSKTFRIPASKNKNSVNK
ncbi:MAG: metallophosphoesterase [Tannerella sp.]|jgi:Icc-related predicted phosphoesterase|nr:metallophosphoesterase [Tannerella sp.]